MHMNELRCAKKCFCFMPSLAIFSSYKIVVVVVDVVVSHVVAYQATRAC